MTGRLAILDIWVDPVSREEALKRVRSYLQAGTRPHAIFAANPEKNFSVPRDPELLRCYREADLLLPDGIGIVLAARRLHGLRLDRVAGSDFFFDICDLAAHEGYKVFVYGAKEAVNKRSVDVLRRRYPGLAIAGRANGYLKEADMPGLIDEMNRSGAQILFLALGSPKQEKWFSAYKHRLHHVRVVQAIGGTLDTIGGDVRRAPAFWGRHRLEWLYRLLTEPKRIRRQRVLPLFAARVLVQWARATAFPSGKGKAR